MKSTFATCVLLLLVPLCAAGQDLLQYSEEAEEQFLAGIGFYRAGRYSEAAESFDRIVRDHAASQRITAAYVMKGKSLYMARQNLEAGRALRTLITSFPTSAYVPDAHLTLGMIYHRIGRAEDAMDELTFAWRGIPAAGSERLKRQVMVAVDTLVDGSIPTPSLEKRIAGAQRRDERGFLWLKLAERHAAGGNISAASVALDTLISRYPEFAGEARTGVVVNRISQQSSLKLGVLLPLMRRSDPSAMKEIGNEVFDGVQFALEEFAADPVTRVRVVAEVRDTERDPRTAAKFVGELASDPEVVGIVGPVFSQSTVAAAESAQARGIPLVTPTATANAIAATGAFVFQANPDFDTRGRAVARFAVTQQGLTKFAVLAPNDPRGRSMAEGFTQEATERGAKVLVTEWYQRGTQDLKGQLTSIRHAGMLEAAEPLIPFTGKMKQVDLLKLVDLGIPPRRLDSLMGKGGQVPATLILGPDAKARLDSVNFPVVYKEPRLDSLEYPVTSIEGIFAPISAPEEIGVVSSQIVYFNFMTRILGSMEWNTLPELDAHKRYCDGVTFESDTYLHPAAMQDGAWENGYVARFKKRPTRNVLYGYDAARLMLTAIRDGGTSRGGLRNLLTAVREYDGLHSKIGLYPRRVNSWVSILRYKSDRIEKVGEINIEAGP
jgi:ABC-type branched-subunit amino acid transport system substrate-binding protein/outer membrane protein assembly factor BamD (BamD/ComL family)